MSSAGAWAQPAGGARGCLAQPAGCDAQPGRDPQEGRLPATGGADDGDELSGRGAQRHVVDGVSTVAEHLGDVLEGDCRRRGRIGGCVPRAYGPHWCTTPSRRSSTGAPAGKWVWTIVSATSRPRWITRRPVTAPATAS